jgi:hypothetical protein
MDTELRFVFEKGNTRIEEINEDGNIIDSIEADWGIIEGYFEIWKAEGIKTINTIEELEQAADKY